MSGDYKSQTPWYDFLDTAWVGIEVSMSVSPKQPSNVQGKRISKAKPPKPFLRFYHSLPLRGRTVSVLKALENAKDATKHRDALAEIIVELTDSGMEYFFLEPLKIAQVGFFVEKSAGLGMSATTGVLGSVIRSVIGGMDGPQLLSVCKYIRQLMK